MLQIHAMFGELVHYGSEPFNNVFSTEDLPWPVHFGVLTTMFTGSFVEKNCCKGG